MQWCSEKITENIKLKPSLLIYSPSAVNHVSRVNVFFTLHSAVNVHCRAFDPQSHHCAVPLKQWFSIIFRHAPPEDRIPPPN